MNTNPTTQELKPRPLGHKWKQEEKLKFNTLEIIKPSTIRSTTNQDHRILLVVPQILTQSTLNSPANLTHKPSKKTNLDHKMNRNKLRSTQSNTIKPRPTQYPNPTTTDQHKNGTITTQKQNYQINDYGELPLDLTTAKTSSLRRTFSMGSMGFLSLTTAVTSSLSFEWVRWRRRRDFEIRESLGLREISSRVKKERERERIRDKV